MMALPIDYSERVYAGVLGKIIGVYVGRPFEGWTYEQIRLELGEITYYINQKLPWAFCLRLPLFFRKTLLMKFRERTI